MARSFRHIVGDDGKFTIELINDMGDAYGALRECFNIIALLTDGHTAAVCSKLAYQAPRSRMICERQNELNWQRRGNK